MDKVLLETVKSIAEDVRGWAEELAYKREQWKSHNLNGYCAIASAELHRRLTRAGIEATLHVSIQSDGSCHVYCVVSDHIVDVTASQFRELRDQPIYIVHHREGQRYYFYDDTASFNTAADLRRHQLQTGWPQKQVAYK